jgi:glycosyltransferase involved in cell wall biosynthesis
VIDSDTGAFYYPWGTGFLLVLQKYLCRNAITTLVTNKHLSDIVGSWGGNSFVIEDPLPDFPKCNKSCHHQNYRITLINTFSPDEPFDAFVTAAREVPDAHFSITGDISKAPPELLRNKPQNVVFTGFLPDEDYIALLKKSDIIAVLCTKDYTLNCGAYEAVSMQKPLILSDFQVLKDHFRLGSVFVDNSPQSIVSGIRNAMALNAKLSDEMRELKMMLEKEWDKKFLDLITIIEEAGFN